MKSCYLILKLAEKTFISSQDEVIDTGLTPTSKNKHKAKRQKKIAFKIMDIWQGQQYCGQMGNKEVRPKPAPANCMRVSRPQGKEGKPRQSLAD